MLFPIKGCFCSHSCLRIFFLVILFTALSIPSKCAGMVVPSKRGCSKYIEPTKPSIPLAPTAQSSPKLFHHSSFKEANFPITHTKETGSLVLEPVCLMDTLLPPLSPTFRCMVKMELFRWAVHWHSPSTQWVFRFMLCFIAVFIVLMLLLCFILRDSITTVIFYML